tara:strand:+ start:512 stop:814 length:303 start_codon:yes stop_codon:yes gene_type:complete
MAKKTVAINSTSMANGTVYYTCPTGTIAKLISFMAYSASGHLRMIAPNFDDYPAFVSSVVNKQDASREVFYLHAGMQLAGHTNTAGSWSVILVEESIGVQ